MNQSKVSALLGRPLTSIESTNFNLYLSIAMQRLEELTCLNLEKKTEARTYDIRQEFKTVFTDLFTTVTEVKVDGNVITDYHPRQWDRRNGSWYNSIVLETRGDVVEVTADWGICSPDLQLLLANLFALVGEMNVSNGNVKSKRVEDFQITFNDNTVYDQFVMDNQATISKYSICNVGDVINGDVCYGGNWHDDYRF